MDYTREKFQEYSKKYNQNILLFFYKPNCEYCDKMKKETISDPEVINLINSNFLPVRINGYSKDTIIFNEKYSETNNLKMKVIIMET